MFLHHSRQLWEQLRSRLLNNKRNDLHCRLIALYPDVPDWWFVIVSLLAVVVIMIVADVSQMLAWYNVLFALSVPVIFVLPFGMVTSITGQFTQNQGVYYLMVTIASALWASDRSRMMTFIAIGYTTYCQTLDLVSNMKLGHYMKIPPRRLFLVQALTCLVCSSLSVGIQYYFYAVRQYYNQEGALEYRSQYDLTNVGAAITNNINFFNSSTPRNRQFLWSLLIGAVLPIPFWFAIRRFKWCHLVHIPLMLATVSWMPLVDAGTLFTWLAIGLVTTMFFKKECWKRHIYLTSSALDAGLYLCLFIIGGPLVYYNINFPTWWGTGGSSGSGCTFSIPNAALVQSVNPRTFNQT
jgi:OPT family oligopeptide transporter